jgi:lipopolysaccharide/colanic/teichoic acid biosynthesis glycosyltransferase
MFNAEPELLDGQEKLRLTLHGNVAGLRRLYSDSLEFCPVPDDWPHHIFIKADIFSKLLDDGYLPLSFQSLLKKCRSNSFNLRSVNIGGNVLDLETENGLLNYCKLGFEETHHSEFTIHKSANISEDTKFINKVLLGKDVRIDKNVVVIGPAVISDNVRIEEGVVINASIIDSGVKVPRNQIINNRIIQKTNDSQICSAQNKSVSLRNYKFIDFSQDALSKYRHWPKISYAKLLKRFADIVTAVFVLILFAPLIPLIALAIKATSPGSVFYRDKRQGLHGKEFNCLKFRTMVTGADQIQEKLRFVSQVDGPQFKMVDDPRISVVGRFLRETYIDEIPQFFNVLLGQMSVVGPRPSPESENVYCPLWREARLSVRPGITGLWQISRTRQPMKDFQEWIRYDIEYVRNLSLKKDLWICWQTVRKLTGNFIDQF